MSLACNRASTGVKAIVNAAALHGTDGPDGAVAQAVPWQREMIEGTETREGIAAFEERRAPRFAWR